MTQKRTEAPHKTKNMKNALLHIFHAFFDWYFVKHLLTTQNKR
jgi:hypothetical protein